MSLLEANLAQLNRRYWDGTHAAAGAELIDGLSDARLEHLLRSHWIDEPSDAATRRRDAVDDLLAYYAMLEVALIAGCISSKLPSDLKKSATARLSREAVRRYYERFYPLALPRLFRQRLEGSTRLPLWMPNAYLEFARFLHVSERGSGKPVDTFLWFVDDGTTKGYGIDDVLEAVSTPKKLLESRSRIRSERTPADNGVDGLLRFLKFARELDQLLIDCATKPVLQSTFWHFHGYWFQQLGGQLAGVLSATIESYREQTGTGQDKATRELITATHTDMNAAQQSLQRLASGIYSHVLDRIVLADGVQPGATIEDAIVAATAVDLSRKALVADAAEAKPKARTRPAIRSTSQD